MLAGVSASATSEAASQRSVASDFRAAGKEFGVPPELLMAMGYVNTHWRMPREASIDGGWGTMHLVEKGSPNTLAAAARLTGAPVRALKRDRRQNIRGGAAVLAYAARRSRPASLSGWYRYVAAVGGGRLYADQVYATLRAGASATVGGELIVLAPQRVIVQRRSRTLGATATPPDYPYATWVPAIPSNYTVADRPVSHPIDKIIVHTIQGSAAGAAAWFQNPSSRVSAHYIVRSSDGAVMQSVAEKDIGWHAGNWAYNETSVGIEHEGFVSDCSWYTDALYRSSARLAAYLAKKYGIPADRAHIIGHNEIPDPDEPGHYGGAGNHTDPGPCWSWTRYMGLVHFYLAYKQVVDNRSPGRFSASANWRRSSWNRARLGADYRYTTPRRISDPAKFKLLIPQDGSYAVYARWPSHVLYSRAAPIGIDTASGRKWVRVNQRRNGGRWMYLGTYPMLAGDRWSIRFSRWTWTRGYIVADAVRIVGPPVYSAAP